MPQSKILLDTNAYLRLARTVHPLLFTPFGEAEYCLYIIPELNRELHGHRLMSKFPWINEAEYAENRKHFPTVSRKARKSINLNFDYIWEHVQSDFPGPSKVDALYIAYALELSVPLATDDQDMTELAAVFEAEVLSTLEVLKIMLDNGHIEMWAIDGMVDYWRYMSDRPANMENDYDRLFGCTLR